MIKPVAQRSRRAPAQETFYYWWEGTPVGAKRPAESRLDALLDIISAELKLDGPRNALVFAMGWTAEGMSRHRNQGARITPDWILKAAIYSGIPYTKLCAAVLEQPVVIPFKESK